LLPEKYSASIYQWPGEVALPVRTAPGSLGSEVLFHEAHALLF